MYFEWCGLCVRNCYHTLPCGGCSCWQLRELFVFPICYLVGAKSPCPVLQKYFAVVDDFPHPSNVMCTSLCGFVVSWTLRAVGPVRNAVVVQCACGDSGWKLQICFAGRKRWCACFHRAPCQSKVEPIKGQVAVGTMLFDFASLLVCVCIFPLTGALKHGTVARANGVGDKFAIAADLLMDAKMQVEQMDGLTKEVEALTADVGAGEDKARLATSLPCYFVNHGQNMFSRRALARLIELSSQCVHCFVWHVLLRCFLFWSRPNSKWVCALTEALVVVIMSFLRPPGNRKSWFDVHFFRQCMYVRA